MRRAVHERVRAYPLVPVYVISVEPEYGPGVFLKRGECRLSLSLTSQMSIATCSGGSGGRCSTVEYKLCEVERCTTTTVHASVKGGSEGKRAAQASGIVCS